MEAGPLSLGVSPGTTQAFAWMRIEGSGAASAGGQQWTRQGPYRAHQEREARRKGQPLSPFIWVTLDSTS